MAIKREEIEILLSPRQLKVLKLYKKAYGEAVVWQKEDKHGNLKARLIDPTEITFL